MAFRDKLLPAPRSGGFHLDDHWVWCGSVVHGPDGLFHMFASVWPKTVLFTPYWRTHSRVVRAVATTPEGPYSFAAEVLLARGPEWWDGRSTHNPTIHTSRDRYYLFYTGTTFPFKPPELTDPPLDYGSPGIRLAGSNQRIGVAVADDPTGPWRRPDAPLMQPDPEGWDSHMLTNPAPLVRADGSVLLIYKSSSGKGSPLQFGVAAADQPEGPYRRLRSTPLLAIEADGEALPMEDAFIWQDEDGYHMLFKEHDGRIGGDPCGGVEAFSSNGIDWQLADPPQAYSRTIQWDDGTQTRLGSLERPQLLIQNGQPTHLFCAASDGPGGVKRGPNTWNQVIPLKR